MVIKFDNLGFEEWNKTYERPNYNRAYSVKQTLDGGYIIVGGKCQYFDSESEIWLIKTDMNGNMQWEKTFGDETTWNMGRCVQLTSDGGYIISGEQLLIKTETDGNEEWSKPIGSMCVQQTTDGGYITTGFKYYWWKDSFKNTDLKIVKTDSNGKVEWTRIYGGEYRDSGHFVIQTPDNGYAIIGYREFDDNYPVQERDIWVIKTGEKPLINNVVSKQIGNIPSFYQRIFNSNGFIINLLPQILLRIINSR